MQEPTNRHIWTRIKSWPYQWVLAGIYSLAAILVTVQRLSLGRLDKGQTAYENYLIFKNSFQNLLAGVNPYGYFDSKQWDLYKYSPAFSLFMAPFSILPDWLGLGIWNLLNGLLFLYALTLLPLNRKQIIGTALFVLPELVLSIQNSQSNGLTAALILLTWAGLEREKEFQAGLSIASGAFLKLFGGLAAIPALLYPNWKNTAIWAAVCSVIFFLLPITFLAPDRFAQLYRWWLELLVADHQASIGLSVAGWLETWFHFTPDKTKLTLAGFIVFLGSMLWALLRTGTPSKRMRMLSWASLLIWVVIFNHKAESPTFIIAMTGVAIWYYAAPHPTRWHKLALLVTFILVSFSPSDLFPRSLRKGLFEPYVIKSVPCILIWIQIQFELIWLGIKPATPHGIEQ